MSRSRRSNPLLTLFGILLLLGLVVRALELLWPLILAGVCIFIVVRVGIALWQHHTRRMAARDREYAEIADRADWQNQAWLAGDPRGLYGDGSSHVT
ncbi:hypothetical protein P3H15_33200 [Rhodococcus sp. T2V]|uniref:hypothetical protein n=1 Tax=Rhodococcus sp. T2V TaxID=3034164 RepID=UPI0023E1DB3E|nr:hypothetical protein [Rhodococcus sp. T2V]MDF3309877.1 hypothetical protein [Rhodococcus sp. T2V]